MFSLKELVGTSISSERGDILKEGIGPPVLDIFFNIESTGQRVQIKV